MRVDARVPCVPPRIFPASPRIFPSFPIFFARGSMPILAIALVTSDASRAFVERRHLIPCNEEEGQ